MLIAILAFYLFATLTIVPAIAVIFARNPVHSVLWLILAFFNAAGLMLLVGAEFIAMLLVIVYVGAVAVLFLFVVMMLDVDFASLRSGFTKNLPFGIIIALVLLAEIVIAVSAWQAGPALSGRHSRRPASPTSSLWGSCSIAATVPVRNRRADPAGGDDRRDRPYPSPPQGHEAAEDFAPGAPPAARMRSRITQPGTARG